jgi:IS30 family transposase
MTSHYSNIRTYHRSPFVTPEVKDIEGHRVHISALLKDGFSITAIVRRLNWKSDCALRNWLKQNPELDKLREYNGKMAQRYSDRVKGMK